MAIKTNKLTRRLGFWDSVAINIGIVIGVGIFRVPADVAAYLDTPFFILLAWVFGGLISLVGVLCYAELSSCFPHTGGTYVYLREAFGKLVGFLFGWMEFSVLRAGSLAGTAYVLAAYLEAYLPLGPYTEKFIAIGAIWFFTLLNCAGIHYGTRVQSVLSSLKVITLLSMTVIIFSSNQSSPFTTIGESNGLLSNLKGFAPALIPVLWGYGGWNESTFMSGEFKDTRRALPHSLITSILIITFLYVGINAAYLKFVPPHEMIHTESIASDIFHSLFGPTGQKIMACAVIVSASGALNSNILTGARIPFAVAKDTAKLNWLGGIHSTFETPIAAYFLNATWASVLVLWGSFGELLFFTGFAKWLFFAMAGCSVFVLRKKAKSAGHTPEGFAMLGYPAVPILFVMVSILLFCTTVYSAPRAALFGALLLATAFPVYFFIRGSNHANPS